MPFFPGTYHRDTLVGSAGADTLEGGLSADSLDGGAGNDVLQGNGTAPSLFHESRAGAAGSPTSSTHASVSADGRYVAFDGGWTAFGSVNNNATDVLVRDDETDTVHNEHQSSAGVNGSSGASGAMLSADGSVLAFLSASSNLVAGGPSGALYDIYVADVSGTAIERVSTGSDGALAADGRSLNPDVSSDGRFVAFESTVSNWAPAGSNATTDIFLKDRQTGVLLRLSTSQSGGDGNGESTAAHLSGDGRFVAFQSSASNLSANDANASTDVFLWDRSTGGLINLSDWMDPLTTRGAGNSLSPDVASVAGSAVVVFGTEKALVAQDTNGGQDIYAFRLADHSFQLVSSRADGSGVQLGSEDASVSADGRFVSFTGYSDSLVPGDTNGSRDVFVKDLVTGEIALVSRLPGVQGNGPSMHSQISAGGDWIVFESSAGNLASTDGNGGFPDVFKTPNPLLRDSLEGGAGTDTANYTGTRAEYSVSRSVDSLLVADHLPVRDGTDVLRNMEVLHFSDRSVDLGAGARATTIAAPTLKTLEELYVGFFNRIPEASGLGYWIDQVHGGMTLTQVANQFYDAGVVFGVYSASFTNQQFIAAVYDYVLYRPAGSPTAPSASEIQYWNDRLVRGLDTKGTMVLQMLSDVHTYFETDPTYGFVAASLNNKAAVANWYANVQGLSLNVQADNIAFGVQMAALITPTDITAAQGLVGLTDNFSTV